MSSNHARASRIIAGVFIGRYRAVGNSIRRARLTHRAYNARGPGPHHSPTRDSYARARYDFTKLIEIIMSAVDNDHELTLGKPIDFLPHTNDEGRGGPATA